MYPAAELVVRAATRSASTGASLRSTVSRTAAVAIADTMAPSQYANKQRTGCRCDIKTKAIPRRIGSNAAMSAIANTMPHTTAPLPCRRRLCCAAGMRGLHQEVGGHADGSIGFGHPTCDFARLSFASRLADGAEVCDECLAVCR